MLKKSVAKVDDKKEEIKEIEERISKIDEEIHNLKDTKKELQERKMNCLIAPFKLGGYALVTLSMGGRSKEKEHKCLLESTDGFFLYVRPIKDNGELSGRHFIIYPVKGSYGGLLKEC